MQTRQGGSEGGSEGGFGVSPHWFFFLKQLVMEITATYFSFVFESCRLTLDCESIFMQKGIFQKGLWHGCVGVRVWEGTGVSDLSQESYLLHFLPQVLHLPPHGETRFRGVVLLSASSAEGCVDKRNNIVISWKPPASAVLFQMI